MNRTILDLCGGTGSWSQPYRDAGYNVIVVDPAAEPVGGSMHLDARLLEVGWLPPIHGVLAAPPCTTFSGSGARWWQDKGVDDLLFGLSVVDACFRIVATVKPKWWVLENPVGRLRRYIGSPDAVFDPWQYGDGYTKKTLLWGSFTMPEPLFTEKPEGTDDRIHKAAPGPGRARLRSITPPGFAQAWFEANP